MSRRTPTAEVPRSMGARPGTAAMPSPSGSGSASRRHSAGSRLVAGQEKTKFRCRDRVGWAFTFVAAAYNLSRDSQFGQRIRGPLAVEICDGVVDGVVERDGVGEGLVGEVMGLEVAPDRLDVIEFGRVFRQPLDSE